MDIWAGPVTQMPTFGTDTLASSIKQFCGGEVVLDWRLQCLLRFCWCFRLRSQHSYPSCSVARWGIRGFDHNGDDDTTPSSSLFLDGLTLQHGLVGEDDFGTTLKARAAALGIKDKIEVVSGVQTGACIVLSSIEDRGFVTHRGATGTLAESHLEEFTHVVMSAPCRHAGPRQPKSIPWWTTT